MSFIGGSFRVKHPDLSIGAGGTATFKFQQRPGRRLRGGDDARAAKAIDAWIAVTDAPSAARLRAFNDPVVKHLFDVGLVDRPTTGEVSAGIIESHLVADGAKTFFELPKGERGKNARSEFLKLAPREEVLFFLDWSVWSNGKIGLALTSSRVIWKCLWEEPVGVAFSDVAPSQITVEESRLTVGDASVDVDDAELAVSIANALRELVAIPELT